MIVPSYLKSCWVSCDRKTCHLLSSHGAHLSDSQSFFNQQKNSDKLHVWNNKTKNNETNTVPIKHLNMLCHSLSPPADITLTHSLSLSARGVLTTVTQPAQLWSVGKAFSGRKWCVSISICVCVCVCGTHQLVCLWRVHTPPSLPHPKWVFCLHCL